MVHRHHLEQIHLSPLPQNSEFHPFFSGADALPLTLGKVGALGTAGTLGTVGAAGTVGTVSTELEILVKHWSAGLDTSITSFPSFPSFESFTSFTSAGFGAGVARAPAPPSAPSPGLTDGFSNRDDLGQFGRLYFPDCKNTRAQHFWRGKLLYPHNARSNVR